MLRNTPSTAGNSMTGSERPSPEPLLKKKRPQPYWGGENSGNSLEASNALNYWAWGIPAVLSREIPGKALRALPGFLRNFFRKVPAVLGVWPICVFFCCIMPSGSASACSSLLWLGVFSCRHQTHACLLPFFQERKFSGKEKAHKHKQIVPVTARVGGGSPDRVGGVKSLCAVCGTQGT